MIAVGLDLSLSGTGIVILDLDDRSHEITPYWWVFKPKVPSPITRVAQVSRLAAIRDEIVSRVRHQGLPDLIVIEDYGFDAKNSMAPLGELGGVVKLELHERGYQVGDKVMIAGTSQLKKFATGVGNAGKPDVLSNVIRRWGFVETTDDNAIDAYVLARIGLCILAERAGMDPTMPPFGAVASQRDVVTAMLEAPKLKGKKAG